MGALDRVFRGRRGGQERPLAAIIAGLWRNGEQGILLEASDLSTMYQDAGGSLPVYMPGSGQVDPPVGLWLDKRLGLSKGPELLANGSFDAGAAGWTVTGQDATHIVTFAAGQMRYQSDTTTPALLVSRAGVLTVGKWYFVEVDVAARVSGSMYLTGLTGAGGSASVFFSPGVTRMILLANATALGIGRNNANVDITLNSISVREIQGNHAYQATTTSRPTLSARYNLLTKSQDFADTAAWVAQSLGAGTAPTRTKDFAAAPDGSITATRLQMALNGGATSGDRSGVAQTVTGLTSSAAYGCAIWLKATTPDSVGKTVLLRHVGGTTYLPCVLTAEWKPYGRSESAWATYGTVTLELRGASGGASDSVDALVWGADLRVANDGVGLPPYQRVVDANTYDTVGFPLYLRFDGVDDFLQTANVDFGGLTSVLTLAAVRKLSDAARGIVVELGATGYGQPGSFNIEQAWFSPNWASSYSGATGSSTVTEPGIASPASAVVGSYADQMAPSIQLRYQGKARTPSTTAVGGGGFINAPLYIGRRGGSSSPANMRLYGLFIRAGAVPGDMIAKVERYLNQKARIY